MIDETINENSPKNTNEDKATEEVAESGEIKYCRYCGHLDNLNYCSRCGLQLEHEIGSLILYLKDRGAIVLEPVWRFLRTFTLLSWRPTIFFDTLWSDDKSVVELPTFRKPASSTQFKAFNRPLTPVGYLFVVTILAAIIGRSAELGEEFSYGLYEPGNFTLDNSPVFLSNVIGSVFQLVEMGEVFENLFRIFAEIIIIL